MRIVIQYLAQLKHAAGVASETLALDPPCSVRQLLLYLAHRPEKPLGNFVLDGKGQLQPSLLVFLGDEQVRTDSTRELRDGDSVTLLTPMAGGAENFLPNLPPRHLTEAEQNRYQWQMWVQGFGQEGQERLKGATVLVSRCGGVGGMVAYALAAAGIGRLLLAHAGHLRPDDLNRQLLMSQEGIGQLRVTQAAQRLRSLNPFLEVIPLAENASEDNVDRLVGQVDVVACCAPLFRERLLLNRAAVQQKKPLVDCAMFELEMQLTTVVPGQSPCLACLYPAEPSAWKRRFPVFGAVAATVGSLGAMEVIKLIANLGQPLVGKLLVGDLGTMTFHQSTIHPNPDCPVCRPSA